MVQGMGGGNALDFTLGISRATVSGVTKFKDLVTTIAQSFVKHFKEEKKLTDTIVERNKMISEAHADQESAEKRINKLLANRDEDIRKISEGVANMSNTLNNVKGFAAIALGIYSVTEALGALKDAGETVDDMLSKSRITFGGYTNALMAYKGFQDKISTGDLFGTANEYMSASQTLMTKGIHITSEMTTTLNDWAAASGKSVTDVASAISSAVDGNVSAFEDFGITSATMKRFGRFEAGTNSMKNAVLDFVKAQKQFNNAAAEAPLTWKNIAERMGAMKDKFFEAIMGHANDPNSLNQMVKRTIKETLDFLSKNAAFFKALATGISATLKWVFKQVGNFARFIIGKSQEAIDALSSYMANYKERIAGFILYLELIKMRIIDFFKAHKEAIMFAIKMYGYFKVAKLALAIGSGITNSVLAYHAQIKALFLTITQSKAFTVFQSLVVALGRTILTNVLAPMASWIAAQIGLNVAMFANPIGLIVAGIAAAVAAVVAIIYYWDELTAMMKKTPNWVIAIVSVFMPIVGIVMLIMKYWKQIKKVVMPIVVWVRNFVVLAFLKIKKFFKAIVDGIIAFAVMVKDFFVRVVTAIWDGIKAVATKIKDFVMAIGRGIYDWLIQPIVDGFNWLWDNLIPDWLKDFGGWLLESLLAVKDKLVAFFTELGSLINPMNWYENKTQAVVSVATNVLQGTMGGGGSLISGFMGATGITGDDILNVLGSAPSANDLGNAVAAEGGTGWYVDADGNIVDKDPNAVTAPTTGTGSTPSLLPSFEGLFKPQAATTTNTTNVQKGAVTINLMSSGDDETNAKKVSQAVEDNLRKMQRKETLKGK
jgi:hypothetical protein